VQHRRIAFPLTQERYSKRCHRTPIRLGIIVVAIADGLRPHPHIWGLVVSVESNANVIPLQTNRGRLAFAEPRAPSSQPDTGPNPSSLVNPDARASAPQIAAAALAVLLVILR
jgi:hypothetical protein